MMKMFLLLGIIAALFLASCSDAYKFSEGSESELELQGIVCGKSGLYVDAYANISLRDDGKYYYSYWIIDGETVSNSYNNPDVRKKVSYGEHLIKFVLIDSFEDILSDSCYININESLKVTLLSPVEAYEAEKTDTIRFQYKISGIDIWEENLKTIVYISSNKEVWKNGKQIDSLLLPPLTEQTYYWGIKAFTERDTAYSEIRSVCIKK